MYIYTTTVRGLVESPINRWFPHLQRPTAHPVHSLNISRWMLRSRDLTPAMYPMSRPINSPAWGLDRKKWRLLWVLFKGPRPPFFQGPENFLLEGKGFFNGGGVVARCYSFFLAKFWLQRRLLLQLVEIFPARCVENPTGLQGVPTDATKQSTRIPKCFHKGQLNLWRPCLFMYGLLMRGALNWSISTQIRERRRQQLIQPSGCHRAPERHLDGSPDRSNEAGNPSGVAVAVLGGADDLLCIWIWNFHTPCMCICTCCIRAAYIHM